MSLDFWYASTMSRASTSMAEKPKRPPPSILLTKCGVFWKNAAFCRGRGLWEHLSGAGSRRSAVRRSARAPYRHGFLLQPGKSASSSALIASAQMALTWNPCASSRRASERRKAKVRSRAIGVSWMMLRALTKLPARPARGGRRCSPARLRDAAGELLRQQSFDSVSRPDLRRKR